MENIVPIAEMRNHISKVLEEIRYGVAAQRDTGLIVDMPEEVTFQCQVVFEFQSLAVRRVSETVEDSDRTQSETATDTGTTTRDSDSSQRATVVHNQSAQSDSEQTTTYGADG